MIYHICLHLNCVWWLCHVTSGLKSQSEYTRSKDTLLKSSWCLSAADEDDLVNWCPAAAHCSVISAFPTLIAHCTLHTAHCTLHIAHCTLHTAHCTSQIANCTLYITHCSVISAFPRLIAPTRKPHCPPHLHLLSTYCPTHYLFIPPRLFDAKDNQWEFSPSTRSWSNICFKMYGVFSWLLCQLLAQLYTTA